jgi:hypothetical protein
VVGYAFGRVLFRAKRMVVALLLIGFAANLGGCGNCGR